MSSSSLRHGRFQILGDSGLQPRRTCGQETRGANAKGGESSREMRAGEVAQGLRSQGATPGNLGSIPCIQAVTTVPRRQAYT